MRRRLCAAILVLQAVVVGLATPVMVLVAHVPQVVSLGLGLGLAAACVVVAGLLRMRWAYALGWAIQVGALALGVVVTSMVVLGLIFAALWATAYLLGGKIDRERAEAYRAHEAER